MANRKHAQSMTHTELLRYRNYHKMFGCKPDRIIRRLMTDIDRGGRAMSPMKAYQFREGMYWMLKQYGVTGDDAERMIWNAFPPASWETEKEDESEKEVI